MGQITYITTDDEHAAFRARLIEAGIITPGDRPSVGRVYLGKHAIAAKKADLIKHGFLAPGAGKDKLAFDDGWFSA